MAEIPENSKPVIVRVKRKADQSPLQALWLEINERPLKRPLLDFQKLSISGSGSASGSAPPQEELKIRRVLVQHVETLSTSQATIDFLHSFVHPTTHSSPKFKASSKERRRSFQKEKKHDQLLSKAKQEQEYLAKSARFEQIWKQRGNNKAIHGEAADEVYRVYDVLRVDMEDTFESAEQREAISVEDQETLSKFLPLLRECIPSAAEEIESNIRSHPLNQDPTDEYVYDLYAIKEKIEETEQAYPFPLVRVEDDDDLFYDGPDDSDCETDDSNAENNPLNDYPEEESSEDEEEESKSESCCSVSEEVETDTDRSRSDDSECMERLEGRFSEDEMDNTYNDPDHGYYDDAENGRWDYH